MTRPLPERKAPGQNTSGRNTPGQNAPGRRAAGRQAPGQNTPGQNTPGQNTSGRQAPGRKAEAARNDAAILAGARSTFLRDAHAPMSAVADAAGVGVGGLYRRYPNKEALLQRLCGDGLHDFVALAEAALDDPGDPFDALAGFLRGVLAADLHSLTVHLAGTFRSTDALRALAVRSADLVGELVARAAAAGRLRSGFAATDVPLLLEQLTAVRVTDAKRTRALRDRALDVVLLGLDVTPPSTAIPGDPPTPAEIGERWRPSHRRG